MCSSRTEHRDGFHLRLKTKLCGKTHQALNSRRSVKAMQKKKKGENNHGFQEKNKQDSL